jgi:hypothetical protein
LPQFFCFACMRVCTWCVVHVWCVCVLCACVCTCGCCVHAWCVGVVCVVCVSVVCMGVYGCVLCAWVCTGACCVLYVVRACVWCGVCWVCFFNFNNQVMILINSHLKDSK